MVVISSTFYLLIELQTIETSESNVFTTEYFESQNVQTHPIPIANVCKTESEEQFRTPDSEYAQGNLDNLETSHSPHDIVQIESSGENTKSFDESEVSSCVLNGASVCLQYNFIVYI